MHHNKHCYRFENISLFASPIYNKSTKLIDNINSNNAIFDSFVDATYIITMEENGRFNNIRAQLSKYIPTSNIYIVYNKGFKKCNKKLPKQITRYDLVDAYINVLVHAIQNKYNNILILEDDFIFDKKILDKNIINEIKNFFEENKNKIFCFNLGPLPFLFNRNIHDNIYRCNDCLGAHGIIYNESIIKNILNHYYQNNKNIKEEHWDKFLVSNYDCYFYKYPLCYQKLEETENQLNWAFNDDKNEVLYRVKSSITKWFISTFKLDTDPKNGFNLVYKLFFIIHYLIIFIVLSLISYIIYYFFIKKKLIKK